MGNLVSADWHKRQEARERFVARQERGRIRPWGVGIRGPLSNSLRMGKGAPVGRLQKEKNRLWGGASSEGGSEENQEVTSSPRKKIINA